MGVHPQTHLHPYERDAPQTLHPYDRDAPQTRHVYDGDVPQTLHLYDRDAPQTRAPTALVKKADRHFADMNGGGGARGGGGSAARSHADVDRVEEDAAGSENHCAKAKDVHNGLSNGLFPVGAGAEAKVTC